MLTPQQREEFCTQGYTIIRGAFPREDALAWVRAECARIGYDVDDPSTWEKDYVRISTERAEALPEYAPVGWQAACDLMGGEERTRYAPSINLFAMNFRQGADQPWQPPSSSVGGWHIDGWDFRHFLDSPEQGLLGLALLTDVHPKGGATFVAADSMAVISRYLAAHPEGEADYLMPVEELIGECRDFREATGQAGDLYLLHPFTLHAVSQNSLRLPRAICNVRYELREPMNFDRADGAYSPVEEAVLRGLGVDRYAFQPTAPRYRTEDFGPINPAWR